ncbi:OFA family MFS transporter [Paenactinomyces guangxiensis]|uniref:OFA family MFS transporter n=1 Tax=Paenactinomyces guangxiensis TaxID=1490290 RepID=A0A7W2A923_9BACL|nr:OFA family MFS transporter [Paenactinomyces guangxiensis]MBA4494779.1 OFA family MFS transporter [Paenactinomyces guangxiensis]MBH8591863.1 OFA family MFS transporter [Paenactinomyces guangxiensis]
MKQKNRWLIALSAVAIHLSIGSVYAYSVYKKPLTAELGWDSTDVAFAFTIAIFFLGLSAALFGRFVERRGPRFSAMAAAILFAGGLVGAGLSISAGSLWGFYLTYGVIGGLGLGIGYISPVSTLVKWFPDRRGLATGMAVFGFGVGSLVAGPVAAALMQTVGIPPTFYILGASYFLLMFLGASYIERPPEGWKPEGMKKDTDTGGIPRVKADLAQLTANEAVKTRRFWMLWLMMLVNISSGIMLISVASPMAQEKVGMTPIAAAGMVGLMGIFNGGGRIVWAALSDYIGRPNVYLTFFIIQLIAFLVLPVVTSAILFQIFIYTILTIYGGGFSSLPAFIADLFGTKELGAIHGYLLTAWSLAGVVGPMAVAYIRETTNSYNSAFYIFAVLLAIALVTSLLIRLDIRRIRKQGGQLELKKA